MHGKELEDKSRLSECGLDDETPTVHLVMRLPAPGTARRKREPASSSKEAGAAGANSVGARITQGPKVKNEPVQEDDLAAMSFAGMRQLSDMLVDGDAMEFDQVIHLSFRCKMTSPIPPRDVSGFRLGYTLTFGLRV